MHKSAQWQESDRGHKSESQLYLELNNALTCSYITLQKQ